jgi:hypothetical protein
LWLCRRQLVPKVGDGVAAGDTAGLRKIFPVMTFFEIPLHPGMAEFSF